MRFPRQEYQSGLPFPSPGDLPDPGIEPASPAWLAESLPLSQKKSPNIDLQNTNTLLKEKKKKTRPLKSGVVCFTQTACPALAALCVRCSKAVNYKGAVHHPWGFLRMFWVERP